MTATPQALFASVNKSFESHAPGKLYLFPYPAADPGGVTPTNATRVAGFMALLYGADTTYSIPTGTPWGDIDENGCHFAVKTDSLEFGHNDGSVPGKIVSGVKSAGVEFSVYDCDANHWADVFGCASSDLIAIAATATSGARGATLLGLPNSGLKWVAILAVQSAQFPGYFDHYIFPRVNFLTDPDVKLSQKDKISMKVSLNCNGDLYTNTAAGIPVFSIPVITTSAHT